MKSMKKTTVLHLLGYLLLLASAMALASAKVHHHNFVVQATPVKRLCNTVNIVTINGQYPGPTLDVKEGDTLVVKVVNKAKYNITIHWHGVRQMRTGWADGAEYITQCPIRPGGTYTYRFTVDGQEGTLWWHAHSAWLRATVYGALIIRPKQGTPYPFLKPRRETPILLGEWWNREPDSVMRHAARIGAAPNVSDAHTINGQPGDLYNCSTQDTVVVRISPGERHLLRVNNAAMNQELFFTVANHTLTVVGADAAYLKPFTTDVIMLGPGQTTDVLITGDQSPGRYYIGARPYQGAHSAPFHMYTTTTALLHYTTTTTTTPLFPSFPAFNDTDAATTFAGNLRSLHRAPVPTDINENLFFAVGLGLDACPPGFPSAQCQGPNGTRFTASVNNVSFVVPSGGPDLLWAHKHGVPGAFSTDFPGRPPVEFNYTGNVSRGLWQPTKGTKVYRLKYGDRVQIVLQGTNIEFAENHPIHLHGYNFFVVAQGFGNFDPKKDASRFNLVDPPMRNTVAVPINGWAVIRFIADNPGVWLMHCHLDVHNTWGIAMAFLVEDGVGEFETLEAPPADLPVC